MDLVGLTQTLDIIRILIIFSNRVMKMVVFSCLDFVDFPNPLWDIVDITKSFQVLRLWSFRRNHDLRRKKPDTQRDKFYV